MLQERTQRPIAQAEILLADGSEKRVWSDSTGHYVMTVSEPGRYRLLIKAEGYHLQLVDNVLVTTGKETIADATLAESTQQLGEVSVKASRPSTAIADGYVSVSGHTFDLEQTTRFAGSRNDPSRMAMNFAGVVGNNDTRNDIIIRGNAPNGLLWRVEGVDVPNPNHFGAMGATGGPVPMLNSQTLKTSSFLTGAFPAAYGNALSGVFDLQLRNGNERKREHTFQIGFTGFEVGTEGPLSSKNKSSYLVHYRYSVLGLLSKLGLRFGTGSAAPQYQDLTFKLNFPTAKGNTLSIFGIGGTNRTVFDNTVSAYSDADSYNDYRTAMGVVGATYNTRLTGKTTLRLTSAFTGTKVFNRYDTLGRDENLHPNYRDRSHYTKATTHAQLTHRYSAQGSLLAGVIASNYWFSFHDSTQLASGMRALRNANALVQTYQAYTQWHYTPIDRLTVNVGLHATFLSLNREGVIEPRAGLTYQVTPKATLSAGIGNYSRWQDWMLYFNEPVGDRQPGRLPNQSLGFSKSRQAVLGWTQRVGNDWLLKAETYYQHLYDIPIDQNPSPYSALNEGASFFTTNRTGLINAGTGRNYGVELTAEKPLSNQYYLLSTLSVFDSQYRTLLNQWTPTAFANRFVWNALGGYEWTVGAHNTLAIDVRNTLAGGRRYTPIDLEESRKIGTTIVDDLRPYAAQLPIYSRADIKLTYRRNRPRATFEWSVDVQNVLNHQNAYQMQYSNQFNSLAYSLQMGRYFVVNQRIVF
uniref:TonB-dependent receptor n=1 Tax=Spirosoma terrae TaxID=1968276 RepID=UPI001FEA4883|nr:TonB-dependent receptor [Spirosoma terrae]